MGMFDSFIDEDGHDWQTKAFACTLARYRVGDRLEGVAPPTFQVEVLGSPNGEFIDSLATIRAGVVAAINDIRDPALPLIDYHGYYEKADH